MAWNQVPPVNEPTPGVAREIGRTDAILLFDRSACPKKRTALVGVQRQRCGHLGLVESCQVGVFLGYVSDIGYAVVDSQLYLPGDWATNKESHKRCGILKGVCYRTRHELALEMLRRRDASLPHGSASGDDEMGRPV